MNSDDLINLIKDLNMERYIFWADDLHHDEFLTILKRSKIFVRSPTDDGICSSVLEALSLKVPVVATKNNLRPEGVVTFKAGDEHELSEKVSYVLNNYEKVISNLPLPNIKDTVTEEAKLLAS